MAAWFVIFSLLAIVVGTSLFLLVLAQFDAKIVQPTELFITVLVSGLLLISLLILLFFVFRKSTKTLIRWTRQSALVLVPCVIVVGVITLASIKPQNSLTNPRTSEGIVGKETYADKIKISPEKLLKFTNEKRLSNGKGPLAINEKLNISALSKCQDMVANNYWSHNDKQGREPWRFFNDANYKYVKVGENLAYGFSNEQNLIDGWMLSKLHRENVLDSYTEVGFGVCESEDYVNNGKQIIVVQHFGTPSSNDYSSSKNVNTFSKYKPYYPPVCTKISIPYETIYIDVNYMYEGETQSYGGWNGYRETCTADSNGYRPSEYTSSPYNKTVYRGTKQRNSGSQYNSSPTYSYSQASSIARQNCAQFGDSSGYEQCYNAYMTKFGY